jgi:hypothetical protein
VRTLSKSQPPAPGEGLSIRLHQGTPAQRALKRRPLAHEITVTADKLQGKGWGVERPQALVRARRPPVGAAHGVVSDA